MKHWESGWARKEDGVETSPLIFCQPGKKDFEGGTTSTANDVTCPECTTLLKKYKML